MSVTELLEILQDAVTDGMADAPVMLATQPSWPLAFNVGGVAAAPGDEDPIVWIVEGASPRDNPYAPSSAWDEARR